MAAVGPSAEFGWQSRIVPAAYTSPSGVRLAFLYEDVAIEFQKHTTEFVFPDVSGSFVQDLGRSGRRFPLRVIFSGENYDTVADVFGAMLAERGFGILEHPIYGQHTVVPFGRVRREDRLKTAGNQAIFTVVFYETLELLFPFETGSPVDATNAAVEAYLVAGSEVFASGVNFEKVVDQQSLLDRFVATTKQIQGGMQSIVDKVSGVKRQFNRVATAIESTAETLIGGPLAIASQLSQMAQIPARVAGSISSQIDSYGTLLQRITGVPPSIKGGDDDAQPANNFYSDDLAATNMLMGAVSAAANNEFETRTEAQEAADAILALCDELTAWRDERLTTLELIDTGESHQHVVAAVANISGFLIEMSFTLKQERSIILSEPRTPLDVEGFIYQTAGENLDRLIATNDLVGTQILEIPAGFEVIYHV